MDAGILVQYWPLLLSGFEVTIACWAVGTVLSMLLGLIISLAQRYGPRPLGWLIQAYIEVIRGTPFLVQLFVLYYGGPLLGLRLDALPAGILGFVTVRSSSHWGASLRIFSILILLLSVRSTRGPVPTSRTFWPGRRSSNSSISAPMNGCDTVLSKPIGSGVS